VGVAAVRAPQPLTASEQKGNDLRAKATTFGSEQRGNNFKDFYPKANALPVLYVPCSLDDGLSRVAIFVRPCVDVGVTAVLFHTMCSFISLEKSTAPQNRQLDISINKSEH
jgi:hypothetical protein